ncbi:nicotinamide riboside kinase 1 isoform X5 [Caretta caretta]|uniref:nicotinamide riboside kinase 1 isoform X5 n=1 Tax=Caretta caretta TaxID=8467 RepID=UPI0020949428|nr:nicotinamide riboside kinase 1 isoform X5 [Caretta caretta]
MKSEPRLQQRRSLSSVERRELDRTQIMKVLVIGLGGVTNGGKTTLAKRLGKQLPNCSILYQDDFFKPESEIEIDEHGFKQYDVLDALYMEEMVTSIYSWMKNPTGSSVSTAESKSTPLNLKSTEEVHILIAEGFLLYNYDTRVYQPADPPGYFDGHVWPMYLKHKREMKENTNNIVYLDGTKSEEDLFSHVYNDIVRELETWNK